MRAAWIVLIITSVAANALLTWNCFRCNSNCRSSLPSAALINAENKPSDIFRKAAAVALAFSIFLSFAASSSSLIFSFFSLFNSTSSSKSSSKSSLFSSPDSFKNSILSSRADSDSSIIFLSWSLWDISPFNNCSFNKSSSSLYFSSINPSSFSIPASFNSNILSWISFSNFIRSSPVSSEASSSFCSLSN